MRKFVFACLATLAAGGVAQAQTRVEARDLRALLVHCPAPVATVAIGRFNCKAAACAETPAAAPGMAQILALAAAAQGGLPQSYPQLGQGMSNAMTTALQATNCVQIVERDEELAREAALAGVALQAKPADYLISGAIISLAVSSSTKSMGGGMLPIIGAVNRSTKVASLGIDVRLVDIKGGTIAASRSFDADSRRASWGVGGAGFGGSGALFGRVSSTQSPELDSVANEAVINGANFIAEAIAKDSIDFRPEPPPAPSKR